MANANDYTKLRLLLEEQENFPMIYIHKFIGKNTPAFNRDISKLEVRFTSSVTREGSKASANGAHLALTYHLRANQVEDVIALLQATGQIEDLIMVL